jgi:hypothetical protein
VVTVPKECLVEKQQHDRRRTERRKPFDPRLAAHLGTVVLDEKRDESRRTGGDRRNQPRNVAS